MSKETKVKIKEKAPSTELKEEKPVKTTKKVMKQPPPKPQMPLHAEDDIFETKTKKKDTCGLDNRSPMQWYIDASTSPVQPSKFPWRPYTGKPVPQPKSELEMVSGTETKKGRFTEDNVRDLSAIQEWADANPEKIDYYLLPFSHSFTPSHTALLIVCGNLYMSGRHDLVEFLISRGADVNRTTIRSKYHSYAENSLDLACQSDWKICNLLLSHGARVSAHVLKTGTALNAARFEVWEGARELTRAKCRLLYCANSLPEAGLDGIAGQSNKTNWIAYLPRELISRISALMLGWHHNVTESVGPALRKVAVFGWIAGIDRNQNTEMKFVYDFLTQLVNLNAESGPLCERSGGNCGNQAIPIAITLPVSDDKQGSNKMTSTFAQSGNRYVSDEWLLTFPDSSRAVFSINTDWGVSVSVKSGEKDLIKFCDSVGFTGSLGPVLLISLFSLTRNYYEWSKRRDMMYPRDLGLENYCGACNWAPYKPSLPAWYDEIAAMWCAGRIVHPAFEFSEGYIRPKTKQEEKEEKKAAEKKKGNNWK